MSLPVRTVSRFLAPLFFVYGLYLIIMGVLSPGGAFGGGVVFGVAACLTLVAEETREGPAYNLKSVRMGRTLGFAMIIVTASISLMVMGRFLDTRMIVGEGTILGSPLLVALGFAAGIVVGSEVIIAFEEMIGMGDET